MKEKQGKRIQWIDILKGIAIISVLVGHQVGRTKGILPQMVGVWIYSFHIPLFFFLSGITFSIDKYSGFGEFFIKKCKTLLVPMFFFTIISKVFNYIYYGLILKNPAYRIEYMLDIPKGIILQQNPTFWFLTCLFIAEIIMYWTVRMGKKTKNILEISGVVFAIGVLLIKNFKTFLPWKIDTAFIVVLFIVFGYCIKENKEKISIIQNRIIGLVLLAINIMTAYINYDCFRGVDLATNRLGNPILFLIESITGIVALYIFIQNITGLRIIQFVGRNSLLYYMLGDMMAFIPDIVVYNILHLNVTELGNWGLIVMLLYALIICVCIWPIAIFLDKRMKFLLGRF